MVSSAVLMSGAKESTPKKVSVATSSLGECCKTQEPFKFVGFMLLCFRCEALLDASQVPLMRVGAHMLRFKKHIGQNPNMASLVLGQKLLLCLVFCVPNWTTPLLAFELSNLQHMRLPCLFLVLKRDQRAIHSRAPVAEVGRDRSAGEERSRLQAMFALAGKEASGDPMLSRS